MTDAEQGMSIITLNGYKIELNVFIKYKNLNFRKHIFISNCLLLSLLWCDTY